MAWVSLQNVSMVWIGKMRISMKSHVNQKIATELIVLLGLIWEHLSTASQILRVLCGLYLAKVKVTVLTSPSEGEGTSIFLESAIVELLFYRGLQLKSIELVASGCHELIWGWSLDALVFELVEIDWILMALLAIFTCSLLLLSKFNYELFLLILRWVRLLVQIQVLACLKDLVARVVVRLDWILGGQKVDWLLIIVGWGYFSHHYRSESIIASYLSGPLCILIFE